MKLLHCAFILKNNNTSKMVYITREIVTCSFTLTYLDSITEPFSVEFV